MHDVALHIAALKPLFVSADDVPEEYIASERAIYEAQAAGHPRARAREGRGGQARQAPARRSACSSRSSSATRARRSRAPIEQLRAEIVGRAWARTSRSGDSPCSSLASSAEPGDDARPGAARRGAVFRRVVLKLSGEALMGDEPYGIDPERIAAIARQVHDAHERGRRGRDRRGRRATSSAA